MRTATQRLKEPFRFFSENAGYAVGRRAIGALALARAEQWAEENDVRFDWEYDEAYEEYADAQGDHAGWCSKERQGIPHTHRVLWCGARKGNDILASLAGIIDPDWKYSRVVEAELAFEAMQAQEKPIST